MPPRRRRPRPDEDQSTFVDVLQGLVSGFADVMLSPDARRRIRASTRLIDPALIPQPGPSSTESGTLREIPVEGFVGPVVIPPIERPPPKVPSPTTTPPAPSTPDTMPRPSSPSRLPGAGPPRFPVSVRGVLLDVLWELVFEPYLFPRPQPRPSGPPRRTRPPVDTPTVPAPRPWPDDPFYRELPPFPRNFPIPAPTEPRTRTYDVPLPFPTPVPTRPGTVPRTRTPVRTLPAPVDFPLEIPGEIFDPIIGPFDDPFTVAPPTPQPRAPARPFPRTVPADFPWPTGLPFDLPGSGRRVRPRVVDDPLTPQQPRTRVPRPIKRPLTTLDPDLSPLPEFQPQPRQANPCTEQRTARRRRQKECKKFTTKTIRVCAD